MITSAENLIFNEIDVADRFNFDGGYFVVNDVRGRTNKEIRITTSIIPGRHGSIAKGSDIESRTLEIDYTLKGSSAEDLRTRLEDLHRIFIVDGDKPIQFEDELTRTYYGRLTSLSEREEVGNIHQGTLTILCQLPFKYSPPKTYSIEGAQTDVYNNGVIKAKPIIRANVLSDITYMDVFTNDAFMRVGQPVEAGNTTVQRYERLLSDSMTILLPWVATSTALDGGTIAGSMEASSTSFNAASFGTGTSWHGPALKRTFTGAPLTDFKITTDTTFYNPSSAARGRMEIYMLDDQGVIIGKFAMKRIGSGAYGNTVEARVGDNTNYEYFSSYAGATGTEYRDFFGRMELSRIGNVWEFFVARVNIKTGAQTARYRATYTDSANLYTGNLSQIQLHFGQSGTSPVTTMTNRQISVYRVNPVDSGETAVIANAGDVIEINHVDASITINGESRQDLKDFGAQYFGIPLGRTTLNVEPSDAIDATVTFEEAYL